MSFTEASTVENLVRDLLCGGVTHHTAVGAGPRAQERQARGPRLALPGAREHPAPAPRGLRRGPGSATRSSG